jgi:hypothetical protein
MKKQEEKKKNIFATFLNKDITLKDEFNIYIDDSTTIIKDDFNLFK